MALRVVLILCVMLVACQPQKTEYQWQIPAGFPLPEVPADNPMTEEKVDLGRHIFYDTQLSANQTQSCATCHQQALGFAEPLKVSVGSTGQSHRRNAQSLVNIAYNRTLTWAHSGLDSIEQQILLPMFGEQLVEMGITGSEDKVLNRFRQGRYPALFERAFPNQEVSFDLIVKALASFVRSLVSFNAPFDRYAYQGDDNSISDSAKRGLNLFFSERLECHHCHGGFNFTQSSKHQAQPLDLRPFHNTGLYDLDGKGAYPSEDTGLVEISLDPKDMGRFRAPSLRNVADSAPYMHDGSIDTLEQVIEIYGDGGRGQGVHNPLKSPFIKGFDLSPQDKKDLLAFLLSLSDESFLSNPAQAKPEDGE